MVVTGVGIEVNQANRRINKEETSVPIDAIDTNNLKGYTHPLAFGIGVPMAFILSESEVNEYMPTAESRQALQENSSVTARWWVRSPGSNLSYKILRHGFVNTAGNLIHGNATNSNDLRGLRPALWISQ